MVRFPGRMWAKLLQAAGEGGPLLSPPAPGAVPVSWETARRVIGKAAAGAEGPARDALVVFLCLAGEQARRTRQRSRPLPRGAHLSLLVGGRAPGPLPTDQLIS